MSNKIVYLSQARIWQDGLNQYYAQYQNVKDE